MPIVTLLVLCHLALAEKSYNQDVATWRSIKPPYKFLYRMHENFFLNANHSEVEWSVISVDNRVHASLINFEETRANEIPFDTYVDVNGKQLLPCAYQKVNDGWICGYNRGEFGASVYWFNFDGTKKKKLSKHHVKAFFTDSNQIFAIEGLAHMTSSKGSIIEFMKVDDEWMVSTFLELSDSPEAITKSPSGGYFIATAHKLLSVDMKKQIRIIDPQADWGGWLYPNSLTVDSHGDLYIGMRQYVVRYKYLNKKPDHDFLVPDKSWLHKIKKSECY